MENKEDRVFVEIDTPQVTYRLITSKEQANLASNWKNQQESILAISGVIDHRDANRISFFIDRSEIIGISVQEIEGM